jgi:hypothetical protein
MSPKTGTLFLSACIVVCAGSALNQGAKGQSSASGGTLHVTAPAEPFLGKWKLNPSKSKLSDEMKVAAAGENKYAFDFGSGKLESIVTDGTDQAGEFGTTLAVTVEGPNLWKVVRKQEARTLISAHWELSNNGNTLTDHYTSYKPDGSANPTQDYEYKRTAGSAGFAGTWESTMAPRAFEVQIQPFEGDGLSFVNSEQQSARNIKFDGKDYAAVGPNFPAGFTASGHRVNPQTVQITEKIGGDTFDTQDAELSPDGKTLTMTQHLPSQSKPKIYVFDRE